MTATVMTVSSPRWGMVLFQGIISIIFGLLLLLAPSITIQAVIIFLGAYWLVMGVLTIMGIFIGYTRAHWGWALFSGIIGIIAGILVLGHPLTAAIILPAVLVTVIACLGIMMGAVSIMQGIKGAGWGSILLGILSIILGVLLFLTPLMTTFLLIIMLGALLLIGGISLIINTFTIRSVLKKTQA